MFSYVVFIDIERLIGDVVKNQVVMNVNNIIFDVKRLIGCKFNDDSVQFDMKYWLFMVINDGGKFKLEVEFKNEKKRFILEEISLMVLIKMKEMVEVYLG